MKKDGLFSPLSAKIVGHAAVLRHLSHLLGSKAVPHALLFAGPEAVGKRTVARAFALSLLSHDSAIAAQTERLVSSGTDPDLHLVSRDEEKRDLSVEVVRELLEKLQLKPYYGGAVVAIVDNAEEMNLAAANSLLKTLEEPNSGNVLILVSAAPHRLPETIISRTQLIQFGELTPEETGVLVKQLLSTSIEDKTLLSSLCDIAGTSLQSLYLEPFIDKQTLQLCNTAGLIEHLSTLSAQALSISKRLTALCDAPGDNLGDALNLASELGADKENSERIWEILLRTLRAKLRQTATGEASKHEKLSHLADVLLHAVETQRLTRERTLSAPLQMGEVLARL